MGGSGDRKIGMDLRGDVEGEGVECDQNIGKYQRINGNIIQGKKKRMLRPER